MSDCACKWYVFVCDSANSCYSSIFCHTRMPYCSPSANLNIGNVNLNIGRLAGSREDYQF